jgi:hypothetical protein
VPDWGVEGDGMIGEVGENESTGHGEVLGDGIDSEYGVTCNGIFAAVRKI